MKAMDAHLATCPDCKEAYAKVGPLLDRLEDEVESEVLDDPGLSPEVKEILAKRREDDNWLKRLVDKVEADIEAEMKKRR